VIGLIVMGRFHFARAAVLARVAGFGERIVPLGWLGVRAGLGNRPKLMRRFWENRRLHDSRKCGDGFFHKLFYVWL